MLDKYRSRPKEKIDKSKLSIGEPERLRDPAFLAFVRKLECCVTGKTYGVESAHVSKFNLKATGDKVSDIYCVPLFYEEHRKQHDIGETTYWGKKLEDVRTLGPDLYDIYIKSENKELAKQKANARIRRFRKAKSKTP